MQNDTPSHLKQPPSPQPNLKSNIVTGLLLLLGEKGEKNYCKKKTCHLLQSVLKCKMKPIVKNIEIICLYQTKSLHQNCKILIAYKISDQSKTTEQRKILPLSMMGSITSGVPFQDLSILEAVEF